MRKYMEIARTYMKTQLAWRIDVMFNMIFTIMKIVFAYLLWGIIFQNESMIGGFTFDAMLSYYIVSSFLSQLEMSHGISSEIHDRIRGGTFSKYMVIPVNAELYFLFMEIGIVIFYLGFDFIAAAVWIIIFRIQFCFAKEVIVICCAVIMTLLGMLFMVQLNFLLGLLTLKYQGIETFLRIKNNLMELVAGSIIPLALFPKAVLSLMKLLPFYYVTYLPSMLLIGQCRQEMIFGLVVILTWCIVIQFVIAVIWKKYIKKYDGVGI